MDAQSIVKIKKYISQIILLLFQESQFLILIFSWLDHVNEQMISDQRSKNVSWSAYHAERQVTEKKTDNSVLLPLFKTDSKNVAMIKHGMNVVKLIVDRVNCGQSPVIAFDQPLFTIAKLIQWNWRNLYGEEQFVIMMGPLHTEMAFLKTIGICFIKN